MRLLEGGVVFLLQLQVCGISGKELVLGRDLRRRDWLAAGPALEPRCFVDLGQLEMAVHCEIENRPGESSVVEAHPPYVTHGRSRHGVGRREQGDDRSSAIVDFTIVSATFWQSPQVYLRCEGGCAVHQSSYYTALTRGGLMGMFP
jgi:hypothetical protein